METLSTHTLEAMMFGVPITSKANVRVKALRGSFSGDAKVAGELLGIEGERLIAEALRSGYAFDTVFVREGNEAMLERPLLGGLKAGSIVLLSRDAFASAVETESPQGIAATVMLKETVQPKATELVLVLEDIQDPGNLGALLRSAEAFGAQQIMVTPATVSQWNPKVVRASAGSVFRIPVLRAPLQELVKHLAGHTIYAAVAQEAGASSLLQVKLRFPCALLIGNEGAGLSRAALAVAQQRVRIPCAVESLNAGVAGSTLLYEAMRQREAKA